MHPKIKGLEHMIQTFIDDYPDYNVEVDISKNLNFENGKQPTVDGMMWIVRVGEN